MSKPNNIDALKQIISHIEEAKDLLNFMKNEMKRRFEKFPSENLFRFTDYVEIQNVEKNDIDVGLFLDLAEENKIKHDQVPIKTLIVDIKNLKFFLRILILL